MASCSATQCPGAHMHCRCSSPCCRPYAPQHPSRSNLLHVEPPERTQRQRNADPPFSRRPFVKPSAVATDVPRLAMTSSTPGPDPHTPLLRPAGCGRARSHWHPCYCLQLGICSEHLLTAHRLLVLLGGRQLSERELLCVADERWQPWMVLRLLAQAQSLPAPLPRRRLSFLPKVV